MLNETKNKVVVIFLLFIVLSVFLVRNHYQQKRQEVLLEVYGIEIDFIKVENNGLMVPDLEIRTYSDAALINIPLLISNSGGRAVQLDEVLFDISLAGASTSERKIMGLIVPSNPRELLLEDVEVRTKILDEILTKIEFAEIENANLVLGIDVYIRYPYKIMDREIFRPEIKLTRIEGDISLLRLMGGKSKEDAAKEFVF